MLLTEPAPLQQTDRTAVVYKGRRFIYFSGCDYFRMASHPAVIRALTTGVEDYGLNVAASRLTTGNHLLYRKLERALARFFGAEAALVVPTGYLSNIVVAQALAGQFTHALLDEAAHPALFDAARFLECKTLTFLHCNLASLAATIARCGRQPRLLLMTDGLFSREGRAAPLCQYARLLPPSSRMLVDDAHGAGVLGATGKGTLEHEHLGRRAVIQTITLSKAFGVYGGAVLSSRAVRQRIVQKSRLFVGSTPPPLPLAAAALQSLKILAGRSKIRTRLRNNLRYLRSRLRGVGFNLEELPGPVISLFPRRGHSCAILSKALFRAGIYPPFIRYPGGPETGYFRFVVSSEHNQEAMDRLCQVLASYEGSFGSNPPEA